MSMTASRESSHSPVSCGSMSGSECTKPSMNTSPGYGAPRVTAQFPGREIRAQEQGCVSRRRSTTPGDATWTRGSAVFEELGDGGGDTGAVEAEVGEQRGGL